MKEVVWLLFTYFLANVVSTDQDKPARCFIKIKSISAYNGCPKPNEGYVFVNGKLVWEAGWCSSKPQNRGIWTMIVNPFTCTATNLRQFNTGVNTRNSDILAVYLQLVRDGAIIVGVTADEPMEMLTSAAQNTLEAVGVSIWDVKFRGNFAFVIQKGYPEKTQMVKSLENTVPYSILEVSITGVSIDKLQITAIKKFSVRAESLQQPRRMQDDKNNVA